MFAKLNSYVRWWRMWRSLPVGDWVKGAALYREGKFEAALTYYERGLEKHGNHRASNTARLDYAYCLFQTRKIERAREELRAVIRECPNNREARIRLIRLQLWIGQPLEAALACRRALQALEPDSELIALFLLSALEHGLHDRLLAEAIRSLGTLSPEARSAALLRVANARLDLSRGDYERGKQTLAEVAAEPNAPFDGVLLYAELLMEEGNLAYARHHLRRGLRAAPCHPRILSLLAESYLRPGAFYNPDYAIQLSESACQNSGWISPREMHVLAQAYREGGQKMAALLVAAKAKETSGSMLGRYRDNHKLERLIEDLSSGTLA